MGFNAMFSLKDPKGWKIIARKKLTAPAGWTMVLKWDTKSLATRPQLMVCWLFPLFKSRSTKLLRTFFSICVQGRFGAATSPTVESLVSFCETSQQWWKQQTIEVHLTRKWFRWVMSFRSFLERISNRKTLELPPRRGTIDVRGTYQSKARQSGYSYRSLTWVLEMSWRKKKYLAGSGCPRRAGVRTVPGRNSQTYSLSSALADFSPSEV